jgi:hypothetical protein
MAVSRGFVCGFHRIFAMNRVGHHPARLGQNLLRGLSQVALKLFQLLLDLADFRGDGTLVTSFPCGLGVGVPIRQGLLRLRCLRLRLSRLGVQSLLIGCQIPTKLCGFLLCLSAACLFGIMCLGRYPSIAAVRLGFRLVWLLRRRRRLRNWSIAFWPVIG